MPAGQFTVKQYSHIGYKPRLQKNSWGYRVKGGTKGEVKKGNDKRAIWVHEKQEKEIWRIVFETKDSNSV